MDAIPEAVALVGAGLCTFIVGAVKQALPSKIYDHASLFVTLISGVAIAALFYAGGFVDVSNAGSTETLPL
jgi:hypothetical protein